LEFVVLRPAAAVCERRAAERAEGKISDYAPYRSFYALFEGADRYAVCDDAADAAALAIRILDRLAAGKFRVSVD
jgi:hypothetical protein